MRAGHYSGTRLENGKSARCSLPAPERRSPLATVFFRDLSSRVPRPATSSPSTPLRVLLTPLRAAHFIATQLALALGNPGILETARSTEGSSRSRLLQPPTIPLVDPRSQRHGATSQGWSLPPRAAPTHARAPPPPRPWSTNACGRHPRTRRQRECLALLFLSIAACHSLPLASGSLPSHACSTTRAVPLRRSRRGVGRRKWITRQGQQGRASRPPVSGTREGFGHGSFERCRNRIRRTRLALPSASVRSAGEAWKGKKRRQRREGRERRERREKGDPENRTRTRRGRPSR